MKKFVLIAFSLLLVSGLAKSENYILDREVESVRMLDIKSIKVIRFKDGVELYTSENGRYIFDGKIIDNWIGSDVKFVDSYKMPSFKNSGINMEELAINVGTGDSIRYLFVAPECNECREIIKRIDQSKDAQKRYTFKVIPISTSDYGYKLNEILWCSKDRVKRLTKIYAERAKSVDPENNTTCNPLSLMTAITLAKGIKIRKLPALLDENGSMITGNAELIMNELEKVE